MNLRQRSFDLERMDVPGYSFEDLQGCLLDIERINRFTFAHSQTLKFVEKIYKKHRKISSFPMKLLDVGFGSGELLFQIENMAKRKGFAIELSGIELNPWACKIAKDKNPSSSVEFLECDFKKFDGDVDVIVSSLFTHHLDSDEMTEFIEFMKSKAKMAWYAHDVHRHLIPYHFIRHWTRWMNLHPMVQYDAPLSVARGFSMTEMKEAYSSAQNGFDVRVDWKAPFKLCASGIRKEVV